MSPDRWILYVSVAAVVWFVLAYAVMLFFIGVKRVNEDPHDRDD